MWTRRIAAPDNLVDVPRKLGIGHAQLVGVFLIDRLDRPAGFEVGGDVGELRHEGHAADPFHALPLGRGAHPRFRCIVGRESDDIRFIECALTPVNAIEREPLRTCAIG